MLSPQILLKWGWMVAVVHLRRSQILPRSIRSLGFHSCTFSFGESVWETGTRETAALETAVLPGVVNVNANPSHWSRSRTSLGPLTSLQYLLKSPVRGITSPNSNRGEKQGFPKSETWFGTKGTCCQEDWMELLKISKHSQCFCTLLPEVKWSRGLILEYAEF